MYRHWGKVWYCQLQNQDVVYLYLFFDHGITHFGLYDFGFLDQYQELYPCRA